MRTKKYCLIIIIALTICGFFIIRIFMGTRPFGGLSSNDIAEVTVELAPPDIKLAVSDQEIQELVHILNTVVIYQKDNSYSNDAGQMVTFTIKKTNGENLIVQAYTPFIIINGIGYKAKYEPCEALNSFANNLEAGKNGK